MTAWTAMAVLARNTRRTASSSRISESAFLKSLIDGETAEQGRRNRIVRQTLRLFERQFCPRDAGSADAVIAENTAPLLADRDEHLRQAPPHVLRRLMLDIAVERRLAAGEAVTVVMRSQRLDDRWRVNHPCARDSGAPLPSALRWAWAGAARQHRRHPSPKGKARSPHARQ